MKIGLIGRGHVGTATARLFQAQHQLHTWDITDADPRPDDHFADCEIVVVAVGTPAIADGRLDVTGVEDVVSGVPAKRFLVKSTVSPGTIDRLVRDTNSTVCYWPEYVGQSGYYNPYFPTEIADVPFVVLGGEKETTTWVMRLLQPLLGPTKTYYRCSAVEAEMIKLTENAFFAAKVTFVNEIKRICDAVGADWDTVREGWLLDPRVGRMHTLVFPEAPGFGGACLPKDVAGLHSAAKDAGYDAALLAEILLSNARYRSSDASGGTP